MKYDLVFEGGGAKGMVFVGALEVFNEEKHTFGRLLETSASAVSRDSTRLTSIFAGFGFILIPAG